MYTAFTDAQVFLDNNANIACNRILDIINEEFPSSPGSLFFLTGKVARIVQGETASPCKVISFGSEFGDAFRFCANKLPQLIGAQGSVNFSNQAQIRLSESIYIEVWHLPSAGTIVTIDGILMQNSASIPSFIL